MPPSAKASSTAVAVVAEMIASLRRWPASIPAVNARNIDATSTGPMATNKVAKAVGKMWNRSIHLEQSRAAHAAADAHRDDDVLGLAVLAFHQHMAGQPRPRHPKRMADGDRATVHIVLRWI